MTDLSSRSRRLTRRSALALTLGASAATGLTLRARPAQAATKVRLLTNFFAEPSMGGMYQALASGIYRDHGLDVDIRQGGPQINGIQLLTGGDTDFVMSSAMGAFNAYDNGAPLVAVATNFQRDAQCLVTRPDIGSPADLKGHTILVSTQGRASYWQWLKQRYGYSDDQVSPYTGNFQSFVVDPTIAIGGLISSEPYRIKAAGVAVKSFLLADLGYPPYGSPILAMRPYVEANTDLVARFVKATLIGWKSFLADPKPGLSIIQAENKKADDGWVAYSVETIRRLEFVTGGDAKRLGIGAMTDARWKELADFMTSAGLLKKPDQWQALFTNRYVEAAAILP